MGSNLDNSVTVTATQNPILRRKKRAKKEKFLYAVYKT